jgi:hypothetical protein
MKKKSQKIFLCHASEDKIKVREVNRGLKEYGHTTWLDEECLVAGANWQLEIREAIREADFIIVFLSSASISKRGYVQAEIKQAIDIHEEFPEGRRFIIPVRLDECEIPESLRNLHCCDLFKAGSFEKLLKAIDKHDNPQVNVAITKHKKTASSQFDEPLLEASKAGNLGSLKYYLGITQISMPAILRVILHFT